MSNYNNDLLNEVKKLKETTNSIEGISKVFEKLEIMANKHVEINNAFEANLNHLNEYNKEFSELNSSIKSNILDLKETALKFPEQLSDIVDKNKDLIESNKEVIIKNLIATNMENLKFWNANFENLTNLVSNIKVMIILIMLINFLTLGLLAYNLFFLH